MTGDDFKENAKKKLQLVDLLIENEEWATAAYYMGFVLECILKAASCKTLKLAEFPAFGKGIENNVVAFFNSHDFEQLLIISGLRDLFKFTGEGASSWDGFTQEYQKKLYTSIRYDNKDTFKLTKEKIERMKKYLTEDEHAIITLVDNKSLW